MGANDSPGIGTPSSVTEPTVPLGATTLRKFWAKPEAGVDTV
ncbi:MAG: hypothetical protein R2746_07960 [Acidimicrobiales bacterium]